MCIYRLTFQGIILFYQEIWPVLLVLSLSHLNSDVKNSDSYLGKFGINQNLEFMKSLKFMLWFYTNLDIGFIRPIKN